MGLHRLKPACCKTGQVHTLKLNPHRSLEDVHVKVILTPTNLELGIILIKGWKIQL